MASQKDIKRRRQRVKLLMSLGYSNRKIAKTVGVDEQTIRADRRALGAGNVAREIPHQTHNIPQNCGILPAGNPAPESGKIVSLRKRRIDA